MWPNRNLCSLSETFTRERESAQSFRLARLRLAMRLLHSRPARILPSIVWAALLLSQCTQISRAAGVAGTASLADAARTDRSLVSPMEERLLRDAEDQVWHEHSLLAAAVVASGVSDEAGLRKTIDKYEKLVVELRGTLPADNAIEDQASAVLSFLHQRILHGGYDLQATELHHVLTTGRFNCVSATVFV